MSAGHGGQILLSHATENLLRGHLPKDISLLDLGEHKLKDILQSMHVFQAIAPDLQKEFPMLGALEVFPNNLPIQLTSFIGREKQIVDVIHLLKKVRMVTLIGPGGTGKTRLSIQVANDVLDQYPDGVWLVELAPVSDPLLIPRTIAIAIGLRDEPHRPVIDMLLLCDYLHDKELLLILDNCEHLVEACAQLADWLLHACPQIRILASSREALGMSGETLHLVSSLQLPDLLSPPTVESLSQCEAVRLFTERALAATQNFRLTDENVSSVAQICHHLDGMPLAIELAAGKIRALSAQQIAKRLDDRFRLLTSGSRTALPRHQTLQAAIEWSYNLLSPSEQILFRRLTVFVNGWTLEAAESVCSDEDTVNKAVLKSEDILELLTQLVNKSLVMTEETQGEIRYHMLETIRQFGNNMLNEVNESEALSDRHLEYCLQLAETAEPHLRRAEQIEWLKRLDAEHENLRAALTWTMGKPSAEPALRLAGALGSFWHMRAYLLEGARWLVQVLNKEWDTNNRAEKKARARTLYRRAGIAEVLDEMHNLKTSAESALALCEEVEDSWGIAYSRTLVAFHQGRWRMFKASITSFEQSLNEFQKLGDSWGESLTLSWMGWVLVQMGTREKFLEIIQRAIAHARASGDRDRIAQSLVRFAVELIHDSKWDEAERILQEAEQLFAEIDASYGIGSVRHLRAQIFFIHGNLEKAKAEAKLVLEYYVRVGEKNWQALTLLLLALIAEGENNLKSAVEYAQKGLELRREMGMLGYVALDRILVGLLEYQQGNVEVARQYVRDGLESMPRDDTWIRVHSYAFCLLGGLFVERETQTAVQFLALSESFSHPRDAIFNKPYFDRFLSAARAKLSEDEFTSAWEAGLKMTLDDAVELALQSIEEI
jgi:predicted ATPase